MVILHGWVSDGARKPEGVYHVAISIGGTNGAWALGCRWLEQRNNLADVLFIIVCGTIVLSFLVFIHEGGHYLAARAFGVRVTEFMIGLPGPRIGFTAGGTKFGLTCIPLGGYARICGMESGQMNPHLKAVMASVYKRGEAVMEEVASDCGISNDEAYEALEELTEWGSITGPTKQDQFNTYRTPAFVPTKKQRRQARRLCMAEPVELKAGQSHSITDVDAFFNREYKQQYRSLPFWKRSVILLAGIVMNLLFAMLAFVIIYSVMGFDVANQAGQVTHVTATPLQAIQAGFNVIGMTLQAIIGLFNPTTAAETVSNSTSIIGISVMSADYFAAGFQDALFFMALISVSLGLMNLLPIPPLDGGRFAVEIFQKITRRQVSTRVMGYLSVAGMALFIGFFVIMLNQDVQRFILGNW